MKSENKNVLIAYIPSGKDLQIAKTNNWYRIPVSTKRVPNSVKNRSLKLIAFYQPKVFGDDAFAIRYFGKVSSILVFKRKVLFRSEPINPKSENLYYKIKFEKLHRLPKAIYSQRHRRILFIPTTLEKFERANEINDLFAESPLEETFWESLKKNRIPAERQFLETIKNRNFFLDFAVFCKNRKLAIECDGDTYHTKKESIQSDKRRDNILESNGWNILRYTTDDITYQLDESILQVKETINKYGGYEDPDNEDKYKYLHTHNEEDTLFGNDLEI